MPKIKIVLSDEFRENMIVFYDDGLIAFADEKCWLLLGGDGATIERVWKKEPRSVYYEEFCDWCGDTIVVPDFQDPDICSPFSSLIRIVTRKGG